MTAAFPKTALITGASRGIGRATALALASAGARVLAHYGNSLAEAKSLVDEIRANGGKAETLQADLGTPDGPLELARQVRAAAGDRLDILVSNAGVSKAAAIEDHTIEDFDKLFATMSGVPFFSSSSCSRFWAKAPALFSSLRLPRSSCPAVRGRPALRRFQLTLLRRGQWILWSSIGLPPGTTRGSRQCRRARRDRDGYVELHEDRCRAAIDLGHAGAETHRTSRRRSRRHCIPRIRQGPLDYGRYSPRRWRVQALTSLENSFRSITQSNKSI